MAGRAAASVVPFLLAGLLALVGSSVSAPAFPLHAQDAAQDSAQDSAQDGAQGGGDYEGTGFLRIDPERTLISDPNGYTPCGECHTAEWEVWRETAHATGFDEMHRTESAQDILDRMDLLVAKRQGSVCMRCHYTVGEDRQAVAGVSCESCHGPARDWIDVHNDWGEGVDHPDDESPEHRAERIAASEEGGMLRPSDNIYAVAANCYECHTVPNEDLVNRGGHSTGSSNFEVVERTNEIRHNFVHQQWGDGSGNREQSPGRKRVLFVTGRMLDYEFALRGLARASSEGRYARSMERRAQMAYRTLDAVGSVVEIPEVLEALSLERRLVPNNEEQLTGVAEQLRDLGQRFTDDPDTAALAPLDPFVEGERPLATAGAAVAAASDDGDGAAGDDDASGAAAAGGGGSGAPAESPEAEVEELELPGEIRSRPMWHEESTEYSVVGEGECVRCHADAEEWWYGDPHSRAARGLLGDDPEARRIAATYGIGASGMARGDGICMSCHGTVDDASQRVVSAGVGCESCHGPGSAYLEPHEDGGNPQLGMRALKDASVRTEQCASCHLVTDERLLASGHPSGEEFEIAAAMDEIEHWPGSRPADGRESRGEPPYEALSAGTLEDAYASVLASRPIPSVEVVRPPEPAGGAADAGGGAAGGGDPGAGGSDAAASGADGAPSTPPVGGTGGTPGAPPADGPPPSVDLEPLPDDTEDLTTEEILLLVKQRLERLYEALGRGN